MHEESGAGGGMNMMDSSSSASGTGGGMRLRPPQDQAQKCPRCDSSHTKFCYYNNYSLSQPRYFCKTCRRYWTQGGTLRNIPVGGGCRKTTHKKHVSKIKPSSSNDVHSPIITTTNNNPTDLHLLGSHHSLFLNNNNIPNFLDGGRYSTAVDFTDTKQLEALRNYDFMGNNINGHDHMAPSFQGLCSPYGIMGLEHGNNVNAHGTSASGSASFVDSCQRMMLPYDDHIQNAAAMPMDVKPKLLALDQWQDQGCSDRESFAGYLNGMGSWTGMINSYGSSASNPLV